MIEAGIDNLLRTNDAINALIAQRVYPLKLGENQTYPAMTYQFVGGSQERGLNTIGLQKRRLQIDCFAGDYPTAAALRQAVIDELNGYCGALSDGTFLKLMDLIQPLDFYDEVTTSFRCGIEFYLYFTFPN